MTKEIIYKRAKTGKIVYYKIWTVGDTIFKETGQIGTDKPLIHKEVCFSKNVGRANETTPEEQAISQCNSDWLKKQDEGYKAVGEVEGDLYKFLDKMLGENNTDASGMAKPMLATDFSKIKKINYPVIIQPKLDGVRCLIFIDISEEKREIKFLSRNGKEYNFPHLLDLKFPEGKYVLDGEIYSDTLTFQEIVSAVKKVREDTYKLSFRCYDIANSSPQEVRIDKVQGIVESINSPFICFVKTLVIFSKEEVVEWHNKWVEEGFEGAMIRLFGSKYGFGQRSRDLIKYKEFNEDEFEFIDFKKGLRDEDLVAICKFGEETVEAIIMGTIAYKKELFDNKEALKGSLLTIKYFGKTDGGMLRFPIAKTFRNY